MDETLNEMEVDGRKKTGASVKEIQKDKKGSYKDYQKSRWKIPG